MGEYVNESRREGSGGGRRLNASGKALPKIAAIVGGILVLGVVAFAGYVSSYDRILPGVTLGGLHVGGMTADEASRHIADNMRFETISVTAGWTAGGETNSEQLELGAAIDANAAAQAAYNTGRDGGLLAKMRAFIGKTDAEYSAPVDQSQIDAAISGIAQKINTAAVDSSSQISGGQIHFTVGTSGYALDSAAAAGHLRSSLERITYGGGASLDLTQFIAETAPKAIDIDALYNKIASPSSEAHFEYTTNAETGKKEVTVVTSGVGYTFDVEQARTLLAQNENFSLPVSEVHPETTSDDLTELLFRDKLGAATTTLNKWNYNRTGNVKLAAQSINEIILAPGDEFSYNEALGQRTYDRGYREASVYVSTGIEDQLGGGICQVSSTLYMSTIRARMTITERRNHAYTVVYTPLGEDATVYWGSIDFKFKNEFDYPVKIVAWQEDDYVTVELWGTNTDNLTVEIECTIHSSDPYSTIQRESASLEYGKTRQVVEGHSGYSVTTYAVVKDADGKQVDRYRLSDSRYKRLNRVLEVGTKGAPAAVVDPPIDTTPPVEAAPADTGPIDTNPVDTTPTDSVPVDTSPVDTTPEAPAEQTPLVPATQE